MCFALDFKAGLSGILGWVVAVVFLFGGAGCKTSASKTTEEYMLTSADAEAAAARMAALLPGAIGPFAAQGPATSSVYLPEAKIRAERKYTSGARTLTVELKTGNIQAEHRIIDQDDAHAFMSDSPTYWRTVQIKGRRGRVAENRGAAASSMIYVRAGERVAVRLIVAPQSKTGEAEELARALDFDAIDVAGLEVPIASKRK